MLSLSHWHSRYAQQARWTRELRQYLYQRAGMLNARRVLEVGCGTGVLLEELGQLFEDTQPMPLLCGLDIALAPCVMAMRSSPAQLTQADAHHLPFPSHTFDITLCHFLLLWVSDPLRVIQEMARVTRPGGFVLALAEPDYGGRLDYPEELTPLATWQIQALHRQGADPFIGRKLGALFYQSGLGEVQRGVLGGQWSTPPSDQDWELEWQVLENDLMLSGEYDAAEIASLRRLDHAAWQHGCRMLFVPTCYAWGKVSA